MTIEKQSTGFKFGKYRLTHLKRCNSIIHMGRTYSLDLVQTHDGIKYYALRLYNQNNHFIKQFLFELNLAPRIANLIKGGIK